MFAGLDFATLPPEVNSARMYTGPGSAPMLAAASAWNGLAAELRATALGYHSVLSELTGEGWHGPASAAMAAATAPYVVWMNTTAAQAEQTAAQAEAAAGAFEAAFAATVPPPVIAANRAQLMTLIATNILGQNTPAIAATETQYAEMWAQDAVAMYGYAASSAVATELSPFTEPQQTTSPSALSGQSAAVAQAAATPAGSQQSTLAQLMSALPNALQGLASPTSSGTGLNSILNGLGLDVFTPGSGSEGTGLAGLLNLVSGSNGSAAGSLLNANIWNTIFSSGFYMPGNFLGNVSDFMGLAGGQAAQQAIGDIAQGPLGETLAGPLGNMFSMGNSVSAGLGRAALVGPMSVPPSWASPAAVPGPLSSALGATPMVGPPATAAGMPPVPMGSMAGQPYGRAVPQYGFRPTFVARPPAAG
ncbi:PPE family protein [Mycobacterium sp.]|uniref:PPE family protein n=1 Tax=Mycobacterium sp. TaxID=1785 RepID=UPI002B7A052D|nr:PPE family protein [Mycobacterium sp.]HTQ21418.1 PPE family protein [Mycobacterium sp.]